MFKTSILTVFFMMIGITLTEPALGSAMPADSAGSHGQTDVDREQIEASFGKLPLYFIENQGQLDESVSYYIRGADKTLYFTGEGITTTLAGQCKERSGWTVKLDFVGANPGIRPCGQAARQTVFSYFKGCSENWRTGIPTFGQVIYKNLWPGIDLAYEGRVNQLKYEFRVAPGADPSRIRLRYRGTEGVGISPDGQLQVQTPSGIFEDATPYAYQTIDGTRVEVEMRYALAEPEPDGSFAYGFDLGIYNPSEPLILDPSFMVYCGFIGGSDSDKGFDIAIDDEGAAYIVGSTRSSHSSFPVTVGPDTTHSYGNTDAFIAKVNPDGTALVYCGYIGGTGGDSAMGVAVDSEGYAYVTGSTTSTESDQFPLAGGPFLIFNGETDAFVAKVNPQGTGLEYCGYIGGGRNDQASAIAVDAQGAAYVVGSTYSLHWTFPVTVGPDLTHNGEYDAFVAKVNPQGSGLDYCGYIGGLMVDYGSGLAVDSQRRAYVVGSVRSTEATFPVTIGPDLTFNGGDPQYTRDAFVARVNALGTGLDYCGYIGGARNEQANDVAVDNDGHAYVVGSTLSDEASFPVVVGPCLIIGNEGDAFVAKVDSQGNDLDYCGYIGGDGGDSAYGIDLDHQGNAYVVGITSSEATSFPVNIGPFLEYKEHYDGFVAKVDAIGSGLDYCGYLGGDETDIAYGSAVDGQGNLYVVGHTESHENTFPIMVGPDLSYNDWDEPDAFVAKIAMAFVADQKELSVSGGSITLDLHAGKFNVGRTYLVLGTLSGTDPGIPLPGGKSTLPLNWDSFTDRVLGGLNGAIFTDFLGSLDAAGNATATLNAPAVNPGKVGQVMHFAYALEGPPWDVISNPVAVEFVP